MRTAFLVAPFVVTLGSGCAREPASAPQTPAPKSDPTVAGTASVTAATSTATATTTASVQKPVVGNGYVTVEERRCVQHYTCNPSATCDPPARRVVPCPLERVARRTDGKCYYDFSSECPKGSKCNPPEPAEVECPAGK